jgi:hypothetical protein
MAAVMDKLRQVGEIDSAAQQELLDKLQQTEPRFWPAVAEQFRASLAYRQELAAKARRSQTSGTAPAVSEAAQREREASPHALPPSTAIGVLADPRRAKSDGLSSEALARATPYSEILPPVATTMALVRPSKLPTPADSTTSAANPLAPPPAPRKQPPSASHAVRAASYSTVVDSDALSTSSAALMPGDDDPDWQQLVVSAADDLAQRVAASPSTTAEVHQHVSLRILRLLAGETEAALEPIPRIPPTEQEYWSRQIFALATYLDHHSQPDDSRRAAASVTHLDEAVTSLRELGLLSLRNLTFCKDVYGYGAVEPYDNDRFSPGQQVALYVEVENFHSRSTEKGFATSLGSTYEIFDEKGERVDGGAFPDVDDCCRTRRRDFHIQFGLALPENIGPGRYQLQLVVKDRQGGKIAHAKAPFTIER